MIWIYLGYLISCISSFTIFVLLTEPSVYFDLGKIVLLGVVVCLLACLEFMAGLLDFGKTVKGRIDCHELTKTRLAVSGCILGLVVSGVIVAIVLGFPKQWFVAGVIISLLLLGGAPAAMLAYYGKSKAGS